MSHRSSIIIHNLIYKNNDQIVIDNLNLTLNMVKTGLVGKNGIGKSTLLKLITRELKPTTGSIQITGHQRYCPQDVTSAYNLTVAQFFGIDKKLQTIDAILHGKIDIDAQSIDDADWQLQEKVCNIARKFAFEIKDFNIKLGQLSNGEITKLYLAKTFYSEPPADFLILDEPTNNLDLTTRKLLYQTIHKSTAGMLIVSHDETLLELMDQIILLDEHGVKIYGGNFNFYQKQKEIDTAAKNTHYHDAKKEFKKVLASTQQSKEKHAQNQAKGDALRKKLDQPKAMLDFAENRSGRTLQTLNKRSIRLINSAKENLEQAKNNLDAEYDIQVSLPDTFVPQDKVLITMENVSFRYSDHQPLILQDFNLIIHGPEHIAIRGNNGSGKTTLVKLIQKELVPQSGIIKVNVRANYLDQELTMLDQNLTILDAYQKLNPKTLENTARKNLAIFLFKNATVLRKVADLSAGEKIRLALASVLPSDEPPELLILDEPTNHLDLENLHCLIAVLQQYEGALIIISHDQKFLEKLKITREIYAPFGNRIFNDQGSRSL